MLKNFFTKKINALILSGVLGASCDQNKLLDLARQQDRNHSQEELSNSEKDEILKKVILQSRNTSTDDSKLVKPILYKKSFNRQGFIDELKKKEGFKSKPYFDQGNLTIGFGTSFAFKYEKDAKTILTQRKKLQTLLNDEKYFNTKLKKDAKNKILKKKLEDTKKQIAKLRASLHTVETRYIGAGNQKFLTWCQKEGYKEKLVLDEKTFLESGLTESQGEILLELILDKTINRIEQTLSASGVERPLSVLPELIQETIIDLGFNIGPNWLNSFSDFKKVLIDIIKSINKSGVNDDNIKELNKKFVLLSSHIKDSKYGKLAPKKYRVRKNIENIEKGIVAEGFTIKGLFI